MWVPHQWNEPGIYLTGIFTWNWNRIMNVKYPWCYLLQSRDLIIWKQFFLLWGQVQRQLLAQGRGGYVLWHLLSLSSPASCPNQSIAYFSNPIPWRYLEFANTVCCFSLRSAMFAFARVVVFSTWKAAFLPLPTPQMPPVHRWRHSTWRIYIYTSCQWYSLYPK